ncbi:MAG: hypothetical protein O7G85_16530 [Planctomycetota bacterium]|nr:hypothetical protein [Planctomycetota bacterium]
MIGIDTLHASNETHDQVLSVRSRLRVALRRWSRVSVVALALVVLGGRLGHWHRYFDDVSHFQVQFLFGAAALFVLLLILRSPRWALVALVCLGLTSWRVIPWYMGPSGSQVASASEGVPVIPGVPGAGVQGAIIHLMPLLSGEGAAYVSESGGFGVITFSR